MVDYAVGTGASGALIIRDDGYTVQAIVRNNSSQTYANGKAWSIQVGGGSASGSFSIGRGPTEVVVWQGAVTTTLGVTFNMGATGTSGLGGPTSVSATIQRSTAPTGAPIAQAWDLITPTTARINFAWPGGDGGAGIDFFLVRYGTSNPPEAGAYTEFTTGTGQNPRTGLVPGVTYYQRSYAHNGNGYGPPSGVAAVTMPSAGKIWNGTGYAQTRLRVWNGNAYVDGRIRVWDGNAYVPAK